MLLFLSTYGSYKEARWIQMLITSNLSYFQHEMFTYRLKGKV